MIKLSHLNKKGESHMVDISNKKNSFRIAKAEGSIYLEKKTIDYIEKGKVTKGNIFEVARISGIMAAKNTHNLIPLCHQINISSIKLTFKTLKEDKKIKILSEVKSNGMTGVEMEALTAVSVSALTIYDMIKSIDKKAVISEIFLMFKDGGKSGRFSHLKDKE